MEWLELLLAGLSLEQVGSMILSLEFGLNRVSQEIKRRELPQSKCLWLADVSMKKGLPSNISYGASLTT